MKPITLRDVLLERQAEQLGAGGADPRASRRARTPCPSSASSPSFASRSSTLLLGRTSDAAVMNPASSSHANSVFSSRLSRVTPVISVACDRIARIIHSG